MECFTGSTQGGWIQCRQRNRYTGRARAAVPTSKILFCQSLAEEVGSIELSILLVPRGRRGCELLGGAGISTEL